MGRVADTDRPRSGPPLDARIAALAARQHGVITVAQLRELGLSTRAAGHRVAAGRLHRMHRGVFAVGHHRVSLAGVRMAAVLACGRGARLAGRSAGALWGVLPAGAGPIEVTTPQRGRSGPRGVLVHRTRVLAPDDTAIVDGIPVTSLARTLVDLAGVLDEDRLERAVHEAEVLRVLDVPEVIAAIDRLPGRRGTGRLRALLAQPSPGPTRRELERRFLALCRAGAIPQPRLNATVALPERLTEVDALWSRERLVVELDGAGAHLTRRAFETDRRRDAMLAAEGYVVVRLTWRRVVHEQEATLAELRRILAVRRTPGSSAPGRIADA
ncbi:MAG TPA: type IV toxin-antitoxin system AbiEi family antitoxin domain-containing protein [Solirubrobacteraceae bacterium]|nr:type IV toxin-antitoxin system AbiEi family antitoxin domain-containing protein [Solirubrobacteraceae bacterium]